MPIRNPKKAAVAAPIRIAMTKETFGSMVPFMMFVQRAEANAPMHMKPACPRESSPEIPTTRFRLTAMME